MQKFLILQRALAGVGVGLVLVALPVVVLAQTGNNTGSFPIGNNTSVPPTGNNTGTCGTANCAVSNPLGPTMTLCGLLQKVFQAVVAIVVPVAVLFIIWSGFQFVLAQGNQKKLQAARRNFYYTIIGLGIFLGAWLIATAIAATINAVGGAPFISCH